MIKCACCDTYNDLIDNFYKKINSTYNNTNAMSNSLLLLKSI